MPQTFTNIPEKETDSHHAAAKKQRTWRAQDKSSQGTGLLTKVETFSKAPQRDAREARAAERREAKRARRERETAEVAPEETQAADTKPATRKKTASKTDSAAQGAPRNAKG